ncbi:uncharacterized protein LOC106011150, partial [Aplysia californica]|uniref:Uncharacterized protein LOC106011150 n=1 Tax=Aplysia californica TaxID=6500 RepID=A0ABM0ZVB9_APLCA
MVQVLWPIAVVLAGTAWSAGIYIAYKIKKGKKINPKVPLVCMASGIIAGVLAILVFTMYRSGVYRKHSGYSLHFCVYFVNSCCCLWISSSIMIRNAARCTIGLTGQVISTCNTSG